MASRVANLKIQQWGNSLAVRIPAAVARSARFSVGQPVELALQDGGVAIRPVGMPRMTLAQKLARFDPEVHGGEAMADRPVGVETN